VPETLSLALSRSAASTDTGLLMISPRATSFGDHLMPAVLLSMNTGPAWRTSDCGGRKRRSC
jgi:hypothetical protein